MKRALVTILAALFVPSAALADTGNAEAEGLFERGRELVRTKNYDAACVLFEQSLRREPGIGTMLWLADCWENQGRTASAFAQFSAAAESAAAKHDEREGVARRRAAALETRLAKIKIVLASAEAGVEVLRDGAPIALDVHVPVDPGRHVIQARAADRRPWQMEVTIAPLAETTVSIPALEPDAAPPAAPRVVAPADPPAPRPPLPAPPRPEFGAQRVVGLSLLGAGVASVGVGSYFGLRAKSTYDHATSSGHCLANNVCDLEGKASRADANDLARSATIAFAAGGAALLGGVIVYLTAPRMTVTPTTDRSGAGVRIEGRF